MPKCRERSKIVGLAGDRRRRGAGFREVGTGSY